MSSIYDENEFFIDELIQTQESEKVRDDITLIGELWTKTRYIKGKKDSYRFYYHIYVLRTTPINSDEVVKYSREVVKSPLINNEFVAKSELTKQFNNILKFILNYGELFRG